MALNSLKEDQDKKLNPGQADYDQKVGDNGAYISSGLDQLEAHANDPKNHEGSSIKEQEESGRDGFYRPSATPGSKGKVKLSGNMMKQKGPIATILAIVFGGGGMMTMLFSPAIGIVHMKETLTNDLNDQLAALDIRGGHVMKARLKGMTSIGCSVKIKCKFSSMTKRQIRKFERAGFKINSDGNNVFGRTRVATIEAPDGKVLNASNFRSEVRNNPAMRKAFNKAFNPAFIGFADNVFKKVLVDRFKTSKSSKLNSKSPEKLNEDMRAVTAGERVGLEADRFVVDEESGKQSYIDNEGKVHLEGSSEYDNAKAKFDDLNSKTSGPDAKKATRGLGSGAIKGLGVLGFADSACTVYNLARAVSSAAKVIRATQLAQYSMVFLTTADKIKAGTATPEEVEYLGSILNEKDMREMVIDESLENADSEKWLFTENPNYGKNAFDSPGYKLAAYGDVSNLSTQSQQFMVGGVSGSLLSMVNDAKNVVQNSIGGDACKVITHPITRIASGIGGIALAIGSFGFGTAVSISASLGISLAIPFLEAYMTDMLAGKIIDEDTKGVEAGDAIFAGTASIMSGTSQARGMKPLTNSELESYTAVSNEIKSEYIAQAKYEARDTPFDITNQYSFLGSLARIAYPISNSSSSGLFSFISSVPKLLISPITNVSNNVKASSYNPDRFNKCSDEGYQNLDIAADLFCNVRYGLTNYELSLDTDEVVDFMLSGNHISPETGEAIDGSGYSSFLNNCVNRSIGLGDSTEDNDNDGSECMATDKATSMYRVYTMDNSIASAMDENDEIEESSGPNPGGGTVPEGSAVAVATQIKNSSNISDNSGQIIQIASGRKTDSGDDIVSANALRVIAALGENNKFTISSMRRYKKLNVGAGDKSWHLTGDAIDLSGNIGINGERIPSYSDFKPSLLTFLIEVANTASANSTRCQLGVPNSRYVAEIKSKATSKCTVFTDTGTSPHIHIGIR